MIQLNKCPICDKELIGRSFYKDNQKTEEYKYCSKRHFHFLYSYGHNIFYIRDKRFSWDYSDSGEKIREVKNKLYKSIDKMKEKSEKMRCARCGKEITEEEKEKIKKAGVRPYCSKYCAEVYGSCARSY